MLALLELFAVFRYFFGTAALHQTGSTKLGLGRLGRITTATLSAEDKMASGKKGPNIHVVPVKDHRKQFVLKEEGNPHPLSRRGTQAETIEKGIPKAKANESELIIHRMNGQFRDSDSYGNDPNPPKDKKH
jgi:hypothetical protein